MHIGIDYGSKMAGTTAICYLEGDRLALICSSKKQDADQFIFDFIQEKSTVHQVFIDAPLSLPKVYKSEPQDDSDYFYRACDRAMKAMSPMFLGGLTARAMKLSNSLKSQNIEFFESYPSALVDEFLLDRNQYKKAGSYIPNIIQALKNHVSFDLIRMPDSWHEVDALLAYLIGVRYQKGQVRKVGDINEGLIYY